jgi:hypothetical protein
LVTRFEPTILKSDAFVPLSESEPVNDPDDIVTLIAPTTVPEGTPAVNELFDRETDEIVAECLTSIVSVAADCACTASPQTRSETISADKSVRIVRMENSAFFVKFLGDTVCSLTATYTM